MLGLWSPDGRSVLIAGNVAGLRLWNASSGEPIFSLGMTTPAHDAAFSPDGKFIAAADDGSVRVWSARTGELLLLRRGDGPYSSLNNSLGTVGFSPDSQWFVTASDDGTARLSPCRNAISLSKIYCRSRKCFALQHLLSSRERPFPGQTTSSPSGEICVSGIRICSRPSRPQIHSWYEQGLKEARGIHDVNAAVFCIDHLQALEQSDGSLASLRQKLLTSAVSPRDPGARPDLIDLTDYYNTLLHLTWEPNVEGKDLGDLPAGVQKLAGVDFDVRGVVRLGEPNDPILPSAVSGIRISRKCRRLHFLQASEGEISNMEGVTIGVYRVHFENRLTLEVPIVYGQDLRDWGAALFGSHPETAGRAQIAWKGSNVASKANGPVLRLYKRTWENPLPDLEIRSIDFVSAHAGTEPFLVALTAE